MERLPIFKNKRALAITIVIGFIALSALGMKAKQIFDRIEHLENLSDDQSSEIEQLKSSLEEQESSIDELKSEIEDLKSER